MGALEEEEQAGSFLPAQFSSDQHSDTPGASFGSLGVQDGSDALGEKFHTVPSCSKDLEAKGAACSEEEALADNTGEEISVVVVAVCASGFAGSDTEDL